MRQIVLDTETTGLEPTQGHRIIEVGCVEIINRRVTKNHFHHYIKPNREVDAGAQAVHGISTAFLADKPLFAAVIDDLLAFIKDAEVIIHNAPFDVGFLNHELKMLGGSYAPFPSYCQVTDTLAMARKMYPGQKNNLDALCKRLNVDNSRRDLHGALLDAEILADVYLAMTGGQSTLLLDSSTTTGNAAAVRRASVRADRPRLRVISANDDELAAHQKLLATIDKASKGKGVWKGLDGIAAPKTTN
ncbi:MAG: DNA polymerase III subunit epsilon [Gammaproteobacteria bacterium]|nr:DNA polymerase III subunit epsilon [Gammaproteobacteria bacterium]